MSTAGAVGGPPQDPPRVLRTPGSRPRCALAFPNQAAWSPSRSRRWGLGRPSTETCVDGRRARGQEGKRRQTVHCNEDRHDEKRQPPGRHRPPGTGQLVQVLVPEPGRPEHALPARRRRAQRRPSRPAAAPTRPTVRPDRHRRLGCPAAPRQGPEWAPLRQPPASGRQWVQQVQLRGRWSACCSGWAWSSKSAFSSRREGVLEEQMRGGSDLDHPRGPTG